MRNSYRYSVFLLINFIQVWQEITAFESSGNFNTGVPVSEIIQENTENLNSLDNEILNDEFLVQELENIQRKSKNIDFTDVLHGTTEVKQKVGSVKRTVLVDQGRSESNKPYSNSSESLFPSRNLRWSAKKEKRLVKPRKKRSLTQPRHYRRFQQPLRAYIAENSPIGTFVLNIPRNYDGKLEILSPNEEVFRINDNEGILETAKLLDYEEKRVYNLLLIDAESYREDTPFYNHDVIIYIVNVNDNNPEFNMASYSGNVNAGSRPGAPVLQLNATDADGGQLGFLIEDKGTPFTVNPYTWMMETNGKKLDHSLQVYPVNVKTFDQEYPGRESLSVLCDINKVNAAPRFTQQSYRIEFAKSSLPGVIIGQVDAVSLSNIPIIYSIEPISDLFSISHGGEVSLKRYVDYSDTATKSWTVTVKAKELTEDKPLSASVDVTLVITNTDQHPTIFEKSVYTAIIDEDVPIGTWVVTAGVRDCDCSDTCQCTPGQIQYRITGASDYFSINSKGEVRTDKELDYDTTRSFTLIVNALDVLDKDTNRRETHAYVLISLRNVNNHAPKFLQPSYRFVVDEDSSIGSLVGVVQAIDQDVTGPALTYTIKSSEPKQGIFVISNENFGLITTAASLKDETESLFKMVIVASDGVQQSEVVVEVTVADVNDNAPVFTQCPKNVNVEENLSPGARVTVLKAVDNDRGLNAKIEYFIESSYDLYSEEHAELFKINNVTGELETAEVLDREKKSHHFIIVSAKDQDKSSELRQVGYCQFVISVDDDNDNYPFFDVAVYETSVEQDTPPGSKVLKIEARDKDVGINAGITYQIDGATSLFQIDSDGWITVKSNLVGQLGLKSFTVTAVNTQPHKGQVQPDGTEKTLVDISIVDEPLPRFREQFFHSEIREDTLVGTSILQLTANTTSPERKMIYQLTEMRYITDDDFPFAVDHSTGVVKLASGLDYERRRRYVFSVNAYEAGSDDIIETSVEITVVDVNDISPIFGRPYYDATVSEYANVGTVVIRIRALDPEQDSSDISYEIANSSDAQYFGIRNQLDSIDIVTSSTFDREEREYYHIILVATDNGKNDHSLDSHTFVTIRVLDENDSPPIFDADNYHVSITENTKVGTIIHTVVTRDKDFGENAHALFVIVAGNDGRFRMESEQHHDRSVGSLVVAKPLDFELRSQYNLTVIASNNKFRASTIIKVQITDSNDDAPYFEKTLYTANVREDTSPGTEILILKAIDEDTPSNMLVYSLDESASPFFEIHHTSGRITTTKTPLDRETTPVIIFAALVTDGENVASTFVEVILLDVNEPPYFPDAPYIGYVDENEPVGTPVRYVFAVDTDNATLNSGKNVRITYSIDVISGTPQVNNDGKMFTIDPNTGLIKTNKTFNVEEIRRNLVIHVQASDEGSPKLSGIVPVSIIIGDVSEFPPKFTETVFTTEVSEDAMLGYVVFNLTVTDRDYTSVGHEFFIDSGNYPFAFYMEPTSGRLILAGIIDYETKKEYNLTVGVTERGISYVFATSYATVLVKILDANDQPPIFKPKAYFRRISEDVTIGTQVRVVTCSDGDDGINAIPSFSITHGNVDDAFEIVNDAENNVLGVVKVTGSLDREKKSSYTMEITATDIGGLTDTATLVVELNDINDSPPTFTPAYYEGTISEAVNTEQRIITIQVSDGDQPPNGSPFTFTLRNYQDKFQLKNSDGFTVDLYTKAVQFNRDILWWYEIVVDATDNGSPALSGTTTVYVTVVDSKINHEPYDGEMMVILYTYQGQFPGGVIAHAYYKDDDYMIDDVEYTLDSQRPGAYFTVDPNSGQIESRLDIPEGEYSLNVTVREITRVGGNNIGKRVLSKVKVRVIDLNESAIQHAVALRFPIRTTNIFVNDVYPKLVQTLVEIFAVTSDHVHVFSISSSSEWVAGSPFGVDVWVAVLDVSGRFIPQTLLFMQLEVNAVKLTGLGFGKVEVGADKCALERKFVGVCSNKLEVLNTYTVIDGYYGQIPTPSTTLTLVVLDTELSDLYTVLPEHERDCSNMPCKNGGTCHDVLPQGYVCECLVEFRGPECQLTTRSFTGPGSYIWLNHLTTYQLSSVSFEFMSELNIGDALLLYQGPILSGENNVWQDFLAIALNNGALKVVLSFGGRPLTFELRSDNRLDDGHWHHVELKQFKKEIRLILDHCRSAVTNVKNGRFFEDRSSCEIIQHTFENFIYLNGLWPLQVGGAEVTAFPVSDITTKSFRGCIRHIYDKWKMYDLRSPMKENNVVMGCKHGCSKLCQNGGYCESHHISSSSCCTCPVGFMGCDCSERSSSLLYSANSFSEYNINGKDSVVYQSFMKKHKGNNLPSFLSYILGPSQKFLFHLILRIRVNSDLNDASFFYASTSTKGESYSELGMRDKVLYYTFKFDDELKILEMNGVNIADSKWHTIFIVQKGNTASLQLDYQGKVYGTTGGVIRLVDFSDGQMYIGGMPRFVDEGYMVGKDGNFGVTFNNREIGKIEYDFNGCTSGVSLNGKQVDQIFPYTRYHVTQGCPCTVDMVCNNGVCSDEEPPYCLCQPGFTGSNCTTVVKPTTAFPSPVVDPRSTGRHRLLDPVWICMFLMSLVILIFLACLLHGLPVMDSERPLIEEHAHDSIMAYQKQGAQGVDTTGYDITLLRKHSRQQVLDEGVETEITATTSSNMNMMKQGEASGMSGGSHVNEGYSEDMVDAGDHLGSVIIQRVIRMEKHYFQSYSNDEMDETQEEGACADLVELSDLDIDDDVTHPDIDVFNIDWNNYEK